MPYQASEKKKRMTVASNGRGKSDVSKMLEFRDISTNVFGGVSRRQRRMAVLAISLGVLLSSLDAAIVNTALPTIGRQLGTSSAEVIWVVSSYQLVMIATMLPLSALGEVVGHRKVFVFGLILFTVTSLLCGLANSLSMLVITRAAQGFGAAAIMGANSALVRIIYRPERLGQGIGLNTLVLAFSLAGGPVVASIVLAVASWHWLFLLNLPIGIAAVLLASRLPDQQLLSGHAFDIAAALLCVGMFCLAFHGISQLSLVSTNMQGFGELVFASVCGAALFFRERGRPAPILPVDLFRNTAFSRSSLTAIFAFSAQGLGLVALPFVFHTTFGRSQVEIGFLIAPWPILGATMAPISGALSDHCPAALLGAIGLTIFSLGIGGVASLGVGTSNLMIVICMMLCGVGFGFFLSPNQRALMSSAPALRSGSASGVLGTVRLLGQATGAALVALGISFSQDRSANSILWCGVAAALIGAMLSLSGLKRQ